MSPPALVIVSDLHLGGGPSATAWGRGFRDEFAADEAFSDFLCWLSARRASRLVLLGDIFDFLRVPVTGRRTGLLARNDGEAVAQLVSIAAAHPRVISGLSAALASGVAVDLVCGNHDAELVRPAVQERLCAILGAQVRFHSWILYVPGLLYAEHGHHHHDINTFACPLYPYVRDSGRLERPPAALLGDLTRLSAAPGSVWHDALTGLCSRPSTRRRTGSCCGLRGQAAKIGLPGDVLAELHDMARPSLLRTARRVAGSRLRHGDRRGYLHDAAAGIRDLMTRCQLGVPYYAFGHTHAALRSRLGADAWYLNSGTWSDAAWGRGSAQRTWIEVSHGAKDAVPAARLFRWADGPEALGDGGDSV